MTAPPVLQFIRDEDNYSLDLDCATEDEATPQPQPILSSLSALNPPRRKRPPRLQNAWSVVTQPPNANKLSPEPQLPTCIHSNCDRTVYFDLNTQEESMYCTEHMTVAHMHTTVLTAHSLDHAMHMRDGSYMAMPLHSIPFPVVDGSSSTFHQKTSAQHQLTELPQQQSTVSANQHGPVGKSQSLTLLHASELAPNFQSSQLSSLPTASPAPGICQRSYCAMVDFFFRQTTA